MHKHADMHTCMHANTTHMCTHMHIPPSGTKHQVDDLPLGCYCWKGFWNHLGQHLILHRRSSLQPRDSNSAKGIPLGELMAESRPNKPATKTVVYSKVFLSGPADPQKGCVVGCRVPVSVEDTRFRQWWLYHNSCLMKGAGHVLKTGLYTG